MLASSIDEIERRSQTSLSQLDNYLTSFDNFESDDESVPAPSKKRTCSSESDDEILPKKKRLDSDEDENSSDRESENESDY